MTGRSALCLPRLFASLAGALSCLLLAVGDVQAATHTVTQNGDAGMGSLRWAVEQANAAPAGEAQEIRFSLAEPFRQINLVTPVTVTHPNVSILGIATPTLDSPGRIRIGVTNPNGFGLLGLTAQVTRLTLRDLDLGPSRNGLGKGGCLDAEAVSPTFSQIRIERVVFSGCLAETGLSGVAEGGAVFANGSVLVREARFVDNRARWIGDPAPQGARATGGALAMERGLLTVIDSSFENNAAEASPGFGGQTRGGAVAYTAANSLGITFERVLFADNRAGDIHCGTGDSPPCSGDGGAIFSLAASTAVRRSAFARNAAVTGAAVYQLGSSEFGLDGRLDLDNVVFNGGIAFRGTVYLAGDTARLRQRNVTYHDISFDERNVVSPSNKIPLLWVSGGRVDVSHSVLIGRVNRTASTQNNPLCLGFGSPPAIQGNSLALEAIDPDSGTHSCAFLGTTRVTLADVGIPESGRWDFEPRGLALENGAVGAPSPSDWARCSPTDAFGRARPIDADGDGTAGCDVGAVEGLAIEPAIFANGFEQSAMALLR